MVVSHCVPHSANSADVAALVPVPTGQPVGQQVREGGGGGRREGRRRERRRREGGEEVCVETDCVCSPCLSLQSGGVTSAAAL